MKFTGRFLTDTRITGTVNAVSTVRLKGKAPYTCKSGEVQYTMFDNANDPNAAPLTPGGSYVGTSAQEFSALLRLNAAGDGFTKAAIQGNLTCKNAKNGLYSVDIMPGRLIAFGDGGAFRGVEHFTTRKAYIKPAYSRVTWTLTGRFANGLMSGNWRVTMRVFHVKRHKQRIDTCTARIPFKGALV